jgi:hypothetical protein
VTAGLEKVLEQDVHELNEQLYASYARIIELNNEIKRLERTIELQNSLIQKLSAGYNVK